MSFHASYSKEPHRGHILSLSKIARRLQNQEAPTAYRKLVDDLSDLILIKFVDAGLASRPSGRSQAVRTLDVIKPQLVVTDNKGCVMLWTRRVQAQEATRWQDCKIVIDDLSKNGIQTSLGE